MDSESLGHIFRSVSKASKEVWEQRLQVYGVHVGQQYLLELLWDRPEGLTVGEIAEKLSVEAPSITRTVQRMARQGLVEKHAHATDARQVIVKLTEKGRALQQVIPAVEARCEEQMFAGITPVERAFMVRLLKHMLHNLEDSPPSA